MLPARGKQPWSQFPEIDVGNKYRKCAYLMGKSCVSAKTKTYPQWPMGLVHSIPNKINACFLDWAKGTNQHIPWDIAMGNNQNGKMDSKQHTDGKQHPQHLIRAILYFIVFYWMYVCVCIYIYIFQCLPTYWRHIPHLCTSPHRTNVQIWSNML